MSASRYRDLSSSLSRGMSPSWKTKGPHRYDINALFPDNFFAMYGWIEADSREEARRMAVDSVGKQVAAELRRRGFDSSQASVKRIIEVARRSDPEPIRRRRR